MGIKINKSDNNNTRKAKKRFKNKIKRKNKQYDPKRRIASINSNTRGIVYEKHVEEFITRNKRNLNKKNWKQINLNTDFCLFNNPSNVLYLLANLLNYAKQSSTTGNLIYKNCISFGAIYLLDSLSYKIGENKKWSLIYKNLPEEEKFLITNLRSIETAIKDDGRTYIVNSRIQINRSDTILAKQDHESKSKEIRDLVQKGIQEVYNKELTHEEHNAIHSAISEHFDNILLHVPTALFGHLCGVYDKNKNEVKILIYNFGISIAENLNKDGLPIDMKEQIDKVIKNHTEKKFFVLESKFTKENALTLLAIQEGISSKISEDRSRGHGLIDFAEKCLGLNDKSKIRIISGRTAIKIDSKYKIEKKHFLDRERRLIALNDKNDMFEKPDPEYVTNMGTFFPGTIIETLIPLYK